jgi:alkylhydroperoxidase family enzyme
MTHALDRNAAEWRQARSFAQELHMATLLNEIVWGESILPPVSDPAWEAEVKRETGMVTEVSRRIAPSPWLRRFYVNTSKLPLTALTLRQADIGFLVTAQENECRYCYGAAKAALRMLGYSDRLIERIEREVEVAELDEKERAFIAFCRNLARSKPRPARAEREALIAIANNCFGNRMATFIACPPELGFERFAGSLLGRLMRPLLSRKMRASHGAPSAAAPSGDESYSPIIQSLAGLPAAAVLNEALNAAFESPVLPRATKALMFAVVARSLACSFCEGAARRLLLAEGFAADEVDVALATLASPRLDSRDAAILAWTRDTVHYKPATIQPLTRALRAEIGDAALLEAVGVAALANATVRLAMLVE